MDRFRIGAITHTCPQRGHPILQKACRSTLASENGSHLDELAVGHGRGRPIFLGMFTS